MTTSDASSFQSRIRVPGAEVLRGQAPVPHGVDGAAPDDPPDRPVAGEDEDQPLLRSRGDGADGPLDRDHGVEVEPAGAVDPVGLREERVDRGDVDQPGRPEGTPGVADPRPLGLDGRRQLMLRRERGIERDRSDQDRRTHDGERFMQLGGHRLGELLAAGQDRADRFRALHRSRPPPLRPVSQVWQCGASVGRDWSMAPSDRLPLDATTIS